MKPQKRIPLGININYINILTKRMPLLYLINISKSQEIKMRFVRSFFIITFFFLITGCAGVKKTGNFSDDFSKNNIDADKWKIIKDGDFKNVAIDILNPGEKLRLKADTINTNSSTKYLGIKSIETIDLSGKRTISFDFEWNNQFNGSYLSGAIYLCPTDTNNPKKESNWLAMEYTGVPPGKNVRINVWSKVNNSLKEIYTDWGKKDKKGKAQGITFGDKPHNMKIIVEQDTITVIENNKELVKFNKELFNSNSAFIYIQMSTGTNYPSREIYFDNISVY